MKKSILYNIFFAVAILFSLSIHAMDEYTINQQERANRLLRADLERALSEEQTPKTAEQELNDTLEVAVSGEKITVCVSEDDDYTDINNLLKEAKKRCISLKLKVRFVKENDSYLDLNKVLNVTDEYELLPISVLAEMLNTYKILNSTSEYQLLQKSELDEKLISELDEKRGGKNIYFKQIKGYLACTFRKPNGEWVFDKPLDVYMPKDLTSKALADDKYNIVAAICNQGDTHEASPIEELDLTGSKLGFRLVNPLSLAIQSGYLGNLKSLSLQRSDIDDPVAKFISGCLKSGRLKNLVVLELGSNQITPMGLASFTFIEAQHVPHLTKLGLSYNPLGGYKSAGELGMVQQGEYIESILTHIPTIKEIDLSSTGLEKDHVSDIEYRYKVKVRSKPSGECTIS